MFSKSRSGAALALFALLGGAHGASAQKLPVITRTPPALLKPSGFALSQIAALQAEKATRTSAEQKIESNLLRAALLARPAYRANALSTSTVSILQTIQISSEAKPDASGMVLVDIKGTVSAALLSQIQASGGIVQGSWPAYNSLRVTLPVSQLETVAANSAALSIRPASQGHLVRTRTDGLHGQISAGPSVTGATVAPARTASARQANVEAHLPAILAHVRASHLPLTTGVNPLISLAALGGGVVNNADPQGDYTQRAALARKTFGVNGSGIKIGVISDSVDGLAGEQRNGSLGPVTVLPSQSGVPGSGEGTAMLEIVHRLAPGAQLYFATAFNGESSFAANIIALQKAGCNVIVDDVSYFDEPPFQDGIIAQAIDTVSASGAYYFSSAGNNYNVDQDGLTANWEGNFVDSGYSLAALGVTGKSGELLAFDSAGDVGNQVLTAPAPYNIEHAYLFWADPQATTTKGATDDYDLYVFDPTGSKVLFSSTDPHTGLPGQDPIQTCEADQGDFIVVAKSSGNSVDLHLFLTSDGAAVLTLATPGGTFGHSCAASCYGTAAADASIPYDAGLTFEPYNVTEYFSSDGPRRIIFNKDGTEITPGNRTSTGGILRQKPVLASSDGISDYFNPFYGTSAAAPHAAAITALVLSADPALQSQPAQMFSLLTSSCIPIDNPSDESNTDSAGNPVFGFAPLPNRDTGYGLLDAFTAVQNAAALNVK